MDNYYINRIVNALEPVLYNKEDLKRLSFYEGAFYVIADLKSHGLPYQKILKKYLEDFLCEGGAIKQNLKIEDPVLLSYFDALISLLTQKMGTNFKTGEEGFKKGLQNPGIVEISEPVEAISLLIDSAEFGYHARREIEYFLLAWNEDALPEAFSRDGIKLVMSEHGDIYLTNSANQIGTLNGYDVELIETE